MIYSNRINQLPPYLFAEIDRKKKAAMDRGVDIISLGVGDPDLPTPPHIVQAGQAALAKAANHQYPFGAGLLRFRQAIAGFMKRRFQVALDPATEIYSLIGSKEGLGHLPLAFLNPGDVALVPDPAYPVYKNATLFAGGEPYLIPLKEERQYLPDLGAIPASILSRAKILFLNYPNNPVAASAPRAFLEEVVPFAKKHQLIVAYDNAYSEMFYDEPPLSFLEIPGAKEVGIEFHSLSKTFNMTGWRLGWVCGNPEMIKGLATIKDSVDSGAFQAIQEAGIEALEASASEAFLKSMRAIYQHRRDLFVGAMTAAGWVMKCPPATFYIWAHAPKGRTSTETAGRLLDEVGVVCTPGVGFGPSGEGHVRFALSVDEKRMMEAVERSNRGEMVMAYIGLGSNLGDRKGLILRALDCLAQTKGISLLSTSTLVETQPVGPIQDQPVFINGVAAVETTLEPLQLLNVLLAIEERLGRIRAQRWGPRIIDLDILEYGSLTLRHPRLVIPHPEIKNRPFVQNGLREVGRERVDQRHPSPISVEGGRRPDEG